MLIVDRLCLSEQIYEYTNRLRWVRKLNKQWTSGVQRFGDAKMSHLYLLCPWSMAAFFLDCQIQIIIEVFVLTVQNCDIYTQWNCWNLLDKRLHCLNKYYLLRMFSIVPCKSMWFHARLISDNQAIYSFLAIFISLPPPVCSLSQLKQNP